MNYRKSCLIMSLALFAFAPFAQRKSIAQSITQFPDAAHVPSVPIAANAATVVPTLIRYSGTALRGDGKAEQGGAIITFLIFKEEEGGEPLWAETQNAMTDAAGHYEVHLGAMSTTGLPSELFTNGEARWLEVQVAGSAPQPRVLIASVAYAMKAADAATLGGLPASAFALAGTIGTGPVAAAPANATPDAGTPVTTTGGTTGYLPVYSGAATIDDSVVYESGSRIGIGTAAPGATLDVLGTIDVRGLLTMESTGSATTSGGKNSQTLEFMASSYNSSSKTPAAPVFTLQAEPTGNNTTAPSGTLNLLFGNGAAPAETGFSIASNGVVKFATGQTFASTSTGGTGVEGTSTSSDGVLGDTAGTTVGTAGVVGVAGTGNTSGFTGIAGVWGNASAHVGVLGTSTQYSGVQGISYSSYGVQGTSTSNTGVLGTSTSGSGVSGLSTSNDGVAGYTAGSTLNTAGVLGLAGSRTSFGGIAAVWGDAAAHVGVFGSSNQYAGVYGASQSGTGVQGTSTMGAGGTFTAGTNGNGEVGVEGTGGSASGSYSGGYGGLFYGGASGNELGAAGGHAIQAYGGSGYSSGGAGIQATGGSSSTIAGDGGDFYGSSNSNGVAGDGIYASTGVNQNNSNDNGVAGYFYGDVSVTGTLGTHANVRKIDHPLDPANKFLNHASIESSEMVNIYSGNVMTDELGLATVQLPTWFEAVNGDFRYQLTIVGRKAQAWISQEIKDGKFQISSDATNAKISWQVTGVRRDAYAKAHPLVVEEAKSIHERGFYTHPELYGQPAEKQSEWGRHPEMMRRRKTALETEKTRLITVPSQVVNAGLVATKTAPKQAVK